jgi:hypothetical protein
MLVMRDDEGRETEIDDFATHFLDTAAQLAHAVQADERRVVIIVDRSFDPPRRYTVDSGGRPILTGETAQ